MTATIEPMPRLSSDSVSHTAASGATYETVLADLALADERILVLTAENRAAIRGLPPRLGARFLDTGITEQTMVGMGAGLALQGRIPVLHGLSAFLTMRAFEFIRTDVGIARLPVKLVGGVAGILSEANGPTHQAIEDVALMRTIPHMQIFCPADTRELLGALPALIAHPDPVYIRYIDRPPVVPYAPAFAIGRAHVLTRGHDLAILSYGALVRESLEAAVLLESAGLSVLLVDMRTLAPIDESVMAMAAQSTRLLVTVEDHVATGGLSTIVAERLVNSGISVQLLPINLGHGWFTPGLLPDALRASRLSGEQIATRVLERLAHLPLD
ncbi:MAG TPA: transketolase C-terminal domain-containing protein [Gemmatimonadaceae bacterium]|nr:transketolase C-terminal domain-containing protein [Gemmatimonadaceae bacterium]